MKFKKISIVLAVMATIIIGCHFSQNTLPADAGSSCATSLTPAMVNGWFESGTASLNGVVKPANSVTFPNSPNCSFYQWSEQMFLWMTSPASAMYGGNGLVMTSPVFYDVSLPDANGHRQFLPHTPGMVRAFNLRTAQKGKLDLPVILEKKTLRMLEILPPVMAESGKQLVQDANGNEVEIGSVKLNKNKQPAVFDLNGNEIVRARAIIQSAKDTSVSMLSTKIRKLGDFDRSTLVQKFTIDKNIFLLDLSGSFHEVEQGQADGTVLSAQNGSLVYYSLTVNNVFALYRTMQGATVPGGTQFPTTQSALNNISAFAVANGQSPIIDSVALAIEIKCSWVEAAGLPDSNKFIRMKAVVPTYDKTNPNDWVPNGTQTIELAMVGMHVVGSTAGHPEMLWGTFEHVSNNPAAAYSYTTNTATTTNVPQNTTGVWNFCSNGSAGPFNVAHMQMGGVDGTHIVNVPGQSMTPTDILRSMPWGLPGASSNGNAEVISTNNVVRSVLDPDDVRINYIQTGTTWTIGGAAPSGGNQVGTNILANTTMETFVQGTTNCFSCHVTNQTPVSHIFDDTDPLF